MYLFDSDSQLDCLSNLLESGCAVNSTGDASEQSPAHLAACGGEAFCLLWLLRTGADANKQDFYGETPVHKAARAGSLECISVLIASDAKLEICNHDGKTAEDLAWSCGYLECGKFLSTLRMSRMKPTASVEHISPRAAQKRTCDFGSVPGGKRACDW